jgi:alanyl-tRNA synthetase
MLIVGGCSAPQIPAVPNLPSAADAQKAVCDSLTAITAGVDRLAAVSANTTVADLKALKAPVDTAVAAIKAANQVLNQANITELTTSYDSLTATINQLPENAAVGETATRVQAGAVAVRDALSGARTALTCP